MKRVFLFFLFLGLFYYGNSEEVIVFLKKGISSSSINAQSIVKKHKNRIVVKVPEGKKVSDFIKELKKNPDVAYVIPNYKVYPQAVPNDPWYRDGYQWYLQNIEWDKVFDPSSSIPQVYVAVIDTGVDYTHPDIKDNIWINDGELLEIDSNNNGIDDGCENNNDDDNNGYIDDCYGYDAISGKGSAMDYDGHGTNVAGIIGATTNNNIGVAGINWNVKIIPCRFMSDGSGNVNDLIECLEYIKTVKNTLNKEGEDIAIINGSYGYTAPADQTLNIDCTQYPDTEKCLIQDIGAIFVAAAGNYTSNNDAYNFLPCNYSVVLDNVICVGSVDRYDNISSFSNYGISTVNIFAPGGERDNNQAIINLDTTQDNDNSDYKGYIGTSQAAPQVAGVLSLLKSIDYTSSNPELIKKVITSGDNLLSLSGYSASCNRLNAYQAVSSSDNLPKICINKPITQDNQNFYYKVGSIETGNTKEFSFKIKSTGTGTLDLGSVYLDKNSNFKITGENCSGKSFTFGQVCEIKLSFSSSEDGTFSDYLNIETNTQYNTIKIQLSGSAYTPKTDTGGGGGGCNMNTTGKYSYLEWLILLSLLFVGKIVLNRRTV
ncbi:S8 family serine peptidase [Persephonella sp. KM09-Lau-8]|uniref:S8 family serine peptidase n=1 Tax=Persephonella sp. KM09-Lau-8 TaxID=1158345 RepID=UPI0004972596|nr:S8 family serine peptidase [Persephonella sp. KM09-Lau-8]